LFNFRDVEEEAELQKSDISECLYFAILISPTRIKKVEN
jgi:hypothetical protein